MKKFNCRNFAFVWLLLGAISAGIVGGCSTAQQCSSEPPEGNLGSVINSSDDEFAPIQFGKSTLLISSTNKERQRKKTPDDEAVLASDYRKVILPSNACDDPSDEFRAELRLSYLLFQFHYQNYRSLFRRAYRHGYENECEFV
ncbi:MAG: hypothetical protein IPM69_06250 [Ignavibacteria bacterium]|nr:hypothetical protein [Ignavibacteria bacterium]